MVVTIHARILTMALWPLERRAGDVHQKAGNEGADVKFARAVAYLLEGGFLAQPAIRAMHREHHNKGLDNGTLLSILSGSIGHVDHDSLQETFDHGFEAGSWQDLHAFASEPSIKNLLTVFSSQMVGMLTFSPESYLTSLWWSDSWDPGDVEPTNLLRVVTMFSRKASTKHGW